MRVDADRVVPRAAEDVVVPFEGEPREVVREALLEVRVCRDDRRGGCEEYGEDAGVRSLHCLRCVEARSSLCRVSENVIDLIDGSL